MHHWSESCDKDPKKRKKDIMNKHMKINCTVPNTFLSKLVKAKTSLCLDNKNANEITLQLRSFKVFLQTYRLGVSLVKVLAMISFIYWWHMNCSLANAIVLVMSKNHGYAGVCVTR